MGNLEVLRVSEEYLLTYDFRDANGFGVLVEVKRNGCAEISHYFLPNGNDTENVDSLHICDLAEFVAQLRFIETDSHEWRDDV